MINRLGVIWICNLQTDYMRPSFNTLGKVLVRVLSEKPKDFDNKQRFKVNLRRSSSRTTSKNTRS